MYGMIVCLSVGMLVLSVSSCAVQVACVHSLLREEHHPSLPSDAPVAVYIPNDLYVWDLDTVDPPVYRGVVPGKNTVIATMGLAGETRRPSDLIHEARRRAREIGCDGVVFDADAFAVTTRHIMSAGVRAIRHSKGIAYQYPHELPEVSTESWLGFLKTLGHEEFARPLGSRELAVITTLSMDHITHKTTGIVLNVTSEEEAMKTIKSLLFRAYASGAVEILQDRRCVATVLEEMPFSYPEQRLMESWESLTEVATALGFPDAGPLRQCQPREREMVGYWPPPPVRYDLNLGTSVELITPVGPMRDDSWDDDSPNVGFGINASAHRKGWEHGWLSLDPGISVSYASVSIEADNDYDLRSTSDVSLMGIGVHGRLIYSLGIEGPSFWLTLGPEVVIVKINARGTSGWLYQERIEEEHSFSSVRWPIAMGASLPPYRNLFISCDTRLKVIKISKEVRGSQLFKADELSQIGIRVHVGRRF